MIYRNGAAQGTGFMVSDRLFMTNNHVLMTAPGLLLVGLHGVQALRIDVLLPRQAAQVFPPLALLRTSAS